MAFQSGLRRVAKRAPRAVEKPSARLAHAAAGDYALIAPVDTPTPIPGVTKRTWRFRANGQYFGVTQYLGAFSDQASCRFESKTDKALLREEAK